MNVFTQRRPRPASDDGQHHEGDETGSHTRAAVRSAAIPRENGGYSPVPGIVALVAIYVIFSVLYPSMLHAYTLYSILLQLGSYGFVALGVVLILIIGEIDLSIGSVAGLGSAIVGTLIVNDGMSWILAIIIGLAAGVAVGAIQGLLVTKLQVPSFVITLGGLLAWEGVQLAILHDTTLNVPNKQLAAFGSQALIQSLSWIIGVAIVVILAAQRLLPLLGSKADRGLVIKRVVESVAFAVVILGGIAVLGQGQGVPLATWVYLALVGATGFVLQRTRAGRAVYAVGGSAEAARRAGYNPTAIRIVVFALSGAFASLGGIYILALGGTADTLTGTGDLVLVAIAAAVIGGCSLFGGRGSPWAAPIGAGVLTTLIEGLNIANKGADLQLILEGLILVIAVAIDSVMRRRIATRQGGDTARKRETGGGGGLMKLFGGAGQNR